MLTPNVSNNSAEPVVKSLEERNHEILLEIRKILKRQQLMATLRLVLFIILVVLPLVLTAFALPSLIAEFRQTLLLTSPQ